MVGFWLFIRKAASNWKICQTIQNTWIPITYTAAAKNERRKMKCSSSNAHFWYPWGVAVCEEVGVRLTCKCAKLRLQQAPQVFPPLSLSWHYIHISLASIRRRSCNILKRRARNWAVDWIRLMCSGVRVCSLCAIAGWNYGGRGSFDFLRVQRAAPNRRSHSNTFNLFNQCKRFLTYFRGKTIFGCVNAWGRDFLNISRKPHVAICGAVKSAICWLDFQTHTHTHA